MNITALDRIIETHKNFVSTLFCIALCVKRRPEGKTVIESLEYLRSFADASTRNNSKRLDDLTTHLLTKGLSPMDAILVALITPLQEFTKSVDEEELRREMRNNLLTFQRDGLEVYYLQELADMANAIDSANVSIDNCVSAIDQWKYTEGRGEHNGEVYLVCYMARQLNEKYNRISTYVKEFQRRSLHKLEVPISAIAETEPGVKLQWSCNPATAGFIIATLVEKGYIAPLPKGDGTVNDTELARICLQLFEFENASPSVDSMRKNLNLHNGNGNQFSQDNRDMFKIPHKSRLMKSNASRNSPNT